MGRTLGGIGGMSGQHSLCEVTFASSLGCLAVFGSLSNLRSEVKLGDSSITTGTSNRREFSSTDEPRGWRVYVGERSRMHFHCRI